MTETSNTGNAGASAPALEVVHLAKTFGDDSIAVRDVSFSVQPGEILSILGPSGCGKTTTMRIIAGLEQPDQGDVLVFGKSVSLTPPHRRNIGLVFQDLALFPHKTVRENVGFGLRMKKVEGSEIDRRVDAALNVVELSPAQFAARMPSELSGGQRQRVAVARTLVVEPSVVLFDEPMAALDRRLRDRMAVELRRIQKQLGIAAIYVTHDQETASMMSDRIAVMSHGSIQQIASPLEIYRQPATRFVADFIGDMSFVQALILERRDGMLLLEVEGNRVELETTGQMPAGDSATLAIRPEHLQLHSTQPPAPLARGSLRSSHFVNGSFFHRVQLASGAEVAVRSRDLGAAIGDTVWLAAEPADLRLLAN